MRYGDVTHRDCCGGPLNPGTRLQLADGPAGRDPSRRTRWVVAATAGSLLLAVSACSGGKSQADLNRQYGLPTAPVPRTPAATSSATAAPPVSPTLLPGSAAAVAPDAQPVAATVRASYVAMWADSATAGQKQDESILQQHAAGHALNLLKGTYTDEKTKQYYASGAVTTNPVVTSLEPTAAPTTAEVTDCYAAGKVRYLRLGSNKVLGTGVAVGGIVKSTVQLQSDGVWRVTDYSTAADKLGSCTPGV